MTDEQILKGYQIVLIGDSIRCILDLIVALILIKFGLCDNRFKKDN